MADEHFKKEDLWSSVIALPLVEDFRNKPDPHAVVIDLNLDCRGGRRSARKKTLRLMEKLMGAERTRDAVMDVGDLPQSLFA